jgi:hypothetical protein
MFNNPVFRETSCLSGRPNRALREKGRGYKILVEPATSVPLEESLLGIPSTLPPQFQQFLLPLAALFKRSILGVFQTLLGQPTEVTYGQVFQ